MGGLAASTAAAPATGALDPPALAQLRNAQDRCERLRENGQPCTATSSYSLQAIYFNARAYDSTSDCLTAAYSRGVPLGVCR